MTLEDMYEKPEWKDKVNTYYMMLKATTAGDPSCLCSAARHQAPTPKLERRKISSFHV